MEENKINVRQLDVWGIYRDPEHLGLYKTPEALEKLEKDAKEQGKPYMETAFDIITKAYHEKPFKKPVWVATNCISKFTLNGKELQRHYDTLLVAEEAGIVVMLASIIRDEPLGVNATDIINYLEQAQIPYEVGGGVPQDDLNDPEIPEVWFANSEDVVRMGVAEAVELGTKHITFDPTAVLNLSIGCISRETGEYIEYFGINGNGLLTTDNNWIMIINEQYEKNVSADRVQEIVDDTQKMLTKSLPENE